MARVTDLERTRVDRLTRQLADRLRASGRRYLMDGVEHVEDVDRWRKAARRAGRLLGWKVRTGVTPDGRRVWVTDARERAELTAAERAADDAAVRRAFDRWSPLG